MTMSILGVLLALSAVTIGTVTGWALAAALTPFVETRPWPARSRAVVLAQLRLLPLATATLLAVTQIHAFVRFEQNRQESAGPLVLLLAAAGVWLLVDAIWRGASAWRHTRLVLREWQRAAAPLMLCGWYGPAWSIRPSFPVVAVVGAWRPRLFIAQQVIDRCTPEELAAIAAHEAAHVAAHDNVIRLLFAITPGGRVFASLASSLEQRWAIAAEEAADTAAAHHATGVDLASALTKVARMAASAPERLMASALIPASDLESRVRRLLAPAGSPQPLRKTLWMPAGCLAIVFASAQTSVVGRALHEWFELLVRSH